MSKVAFVSVMKDADQEVANGVLAALNYKMDKPQDTEHATIFLQQDNVPADVMLFDLGDGVLVGVSEMPTKKADLYGGDTTDFNKALAQQGALPMTNVALDVLRDCVRKAFYASDSNTTAAALVGQAMEDATRYLKSIANALPIDAFKADFELEDAAVALKSEEEDAFFEALQEEVDKDPVLKAELDKPAPTAEEIAAAATAAATATPAPVVKTADPAVAGTPDIAAVVQAAVTAALAPVNAQLEAANARIEKAEGSISTAIIGAKSGDERTSVRKSQTPVNNDDFSFDTGQGRPI